MKVCRFAVYTCHTESLPTLTSLETFVIVTNTDIAGNFCHSFFLILFSNLFGEISYACIDKAKQMDIQSTFHSESVQALTYFELLLGI